MVQLKNQNGRSLHCCRSWICISNSESKLMPMLHVRMWPSIPVMGRLLIPINSLCDIAGAAGMFLIRTMLKTTAKMIPLLPIRLTQKRNQVFPRTSSIRGERNRTWKQNSWMNTGHWERAAPNWMMTDIFYSVFFHGWRRYLLKQIWCFGLKHSKTWCKNYSWLVLLQFLLHTALGLVMQVAMIRPCRILIDC